MVSLKEKTLLTELVNAVVEDFRLKGFQNLNFYERKVLDVVKKIESLRNKESHPQSESSIYAKIEVCLHGSQAEIAELIEGDSDVFTQIIARGDVSIDEENTDSMYIPTEVAEEWETENDMELSYGSTVE